MTSTNLIVYGAIAVCIIGLLIKAPAIGKIWFIGGLCMGFLVGAIATTLREWERDDQD